MLKGVEGAVGIIVVRTLHNGQVDSLQLTSTTMNNTPPTVPDTDVPHTH